MPEVKTPEEEALNKIADLLRLVAIGQKLVDDLQNLVKKGEVPCGNG